VLDAIVFAGHLATPNVLHLAAEYGPFSPVTPLTMSDPLLPPAVVSFVQDLVVIQTVTPTPAVIPDVTAMNNRQLHAVRRAASMINGHTRVGTWKPLTVEQVGDTAFDPVGRHEFMVADPLVVELGSLSLCWVRSSLGLPPPVSNRWLTAAPAWSRTRTTSCITASALRCPRTGRGSFSRGASVIGE